MTREQAEGVMTVLADAVDESVRGMEAGLVSKAEQEKVGVGLLALVIGEPRSPRSNGTRKTSTSHSSNPSCSCTRRTT